MSRPRNPFGSTHPGRLPATMVKVLAAEISDPSRLRRGKQYAKDGSVLDIVIEPGAVVCEIQGSRPTPYLATIEVTPGDGMPLRRDITCTCTCPDDDNWDGHACKHIIAALFALSNELLLEPELLDVWRSRVGDEPAVDQSRSDDADTPTRGTRRHLSLVRPSDEPDSADAGTADADEDRPAARVIEDPLREVLRVPPGTTLPEVPPLEPADLPAPKGRELAATLRDALRHVRVEWD
ncbi:MAG: hypothetical protein HKN44_00595 [Ilumatobacter sp.]|nr:hypothetical protein [Ilumatobacter sp.]